MPQRMPEALPPQESAKLIIDEITSFAHTSPLNRLPAAGDERIFDEPLVHFADGDDPLFTDYKTIIDTGHLTPREALASAYDRPPGDLPRRLSVISWVLPINEKTRISNRSETRLPSRPWSHTRWFGELFNDALREHVTAFLSEKGYLAAAPMKTAFFRMLKCDNGPASNWSERHIAYAAGLGTFGLSDGFITERGIAHRCGSVVTDMALPANPRTASGPYGNCLFYANGECSRCIERCPVGAITENGHDKKRCMQYLHDIGYNPDLFKKNFNLETSVAGCGLCQTKVPCEFRNPVRNSRKETN